MWGEIPLINCVTNLYVTAIFICECSSIPDWLTMIVRSQVPVQCRWNCLMELKVSCWSSKSADGALIQLMEVMISWWSSNSIGDLIKSADLGHPRWSLYQVFLVLFINDSMGIDVGKLLSNPLMSPEQQDFLSFYLHLYLLVFYQWNL